MGILFAKSNKENLNGNFCWAMGVGNGSACVLDYGQRSLNVRRGASKRATPAPFG